MKKRRMLAWLLSLALLCTLVATPVYADEPLPEEHVHSEAAEVHEPTSVGEDEPLRAEASNTAVAGASEDADEAVGDPDPAAPSETSGDSQDASADSSGENAAGDVGVPGDPADSGDDLEDAGSDAGSGEDLADDATGSDAADDGDASDVDDAGDADDAAGGDADGKADAGDGTAKDPTEVGEGEEDEDNSDADPEAEPGADEPSTDETEAEDGVEAEDEDEAEAEAEDEAEADAFAMEVAHDELLDGLQADDLPGPSISIASSGYGSQYCEFPSVSISAPAGIASVKVNGENQGGAGQTSFALSSHSVEFSNDVMSAFSTGKDFTIVVEDQNQRTASVSFKVVHRLGGIDRKTTGATCDQDGYYMQDMLCSRCRQIIVETRMVSERAKGHQLGEVHETSCNGVKIQYQDCSVCRRRIYTEGSAAVDHQFGETKTFEADCENEGITYRECKSCGYRDVSETVPPKGHSFGPWQILESATCDQAGRMKHTCSVCKKTEETTMNPLGHYYIWKSDAEGHWRACGRCGLPEEGGSEIQKAGHSFPEDSGNCLVGIHCTVCGYQLRAAQKQHNFTGDYIDLGESGHTRKCANEGCTVTDTVRAHTWPTTFDGDCTAEVQCTAPGCGAKTHRYVEHSFSGAWRSDADSHFKLCSPPGCEVRVDEAPHTPNTTSGSCTTAVRCSICGYTIRAKKQHEWGPWTPSTTNKNEHVHTCLNCSATETGRHDSITSSSVKIVQVPSKIPTCTSYGSGYTIYYCHLCDQELARGDLGYLAPLGHDYGEPKQMGDGSGPCGATWTERECSRCGAKEKTDEVPGEHLWATEYTVDLDATCDTEGTKSIHCTREGCGATKDPQKIPAKGHELDTENWEWAIRPTCLTDGTQRFTCTVCGKQVDRMAKGSATGHKYSGNYIYNNDATCLTDGTETEYCGNGCGAFVTRTKPNTALGHSFNDDHDCTTAEICTREGCGATSTHYATHSHSETAAWLIDEVKGTHYKMCTNPGCAQRGFEEEHIPEPNDGDCTTPVKCVKCGAVIALGDREHDFGAWVHEGDEHVRKCQREGCNVEVREAHADLSTTVTERSAVTCTSAGYSIEETFCRTCGGLISKKEIHTDPLGHDWGDWTPIATPGCEDEGAEERVCKRDGCTAKETRGLSSTGHTWSEDYEILETPTCTTDGREAYVCLKCGAERDERSIPALDHDLGFVSYAREATCTDDAVVNVKCSRCGLEEVVVREDSALGHDFGEYISDQNATCTEDGTMTAHCQRCSETDTIPEPGSARGHSFNTDHDCTTDDACLFCDAILPGEAAHAASASDPWLVDPDAGTHFKMCDREGCMQPAVTEAHIAAPDDDLCTTPVLCAICGEQMIPGAPAHALGAWVHDGDGDVRSCQTDGCLYSEEKPHNPGEPESEVESEATCVKPGVKIERIYCEDCGALLESQTLEIPATGHSFGPWVDIATPDCDDSGAQERECTVCHEIETNNVNPTGHTWAADYTVDLEPSCTHDGSKSIRCTVCGVVKESVTIPALEHDFQRVDTVKEASCTEGATELAACAMCGLTIERPDESKPALGHDFAAYVSNGDATCLADGTETAKCTRCDAVDTRTVSGTATGHVPDEELGAAVTAPTCTEEGYSTYTCRFCGETWKADFVPATGHKAVHEGDRAATCTSSGYKGGTRCSVCGATLKARTEIPALGHSFGAWSANGNGTHSATCARCQSSQTEPCGYSEIRVGGVLVQICKVCGEVLDPTGGETVAAVRFETVAEATAEAVDPGAMPAGELVVRKLDIPFGEDVQVFEAFTVACELNGEAQPLKGRIRVNLPVDCQMPFRLIRVDVKEDPATGEVTEEWVEIEFSYDNGRIAFETDHDGLFLLVPLDEAI